MINMVIHIRLKYINRKVNHLAPKFIKTNKITSFINRKWNQMCWQDIPFNHTSVKSTYVFGLRPIDNPCTSDTLKVFDPNRLIIFVLRPKLSTRTTSIEGQV